MAAHGKVGTFNESIELWSLCSVPYAYLYHTRMVRIIVPYAYGAYETPLVYIVSS